MIAKTGTVLLSFGWLMVLCSASVFAQSQTTGRIAGIVKDQNGAVIARAEVTVSGKATGEKRKVTTGIVNLIQGETN